MLEGLALFGQAIWHFMSPGTVALAMGSCLVGIVIGALPGLTATMGVALMTTLTLGLDPSLALLILVCTYVGAIYGGSRSAILLNIPGTPASAASCLDGHALARQGLAGQAMGIATAGSVLGTWIGMLFLALLTPVLGELALEFGSYEFFWLAVFGVVISGNLTGGDPLKGWLAGFLGLLLAMVGQESIHAYPRFTFGIPDLAGGFGLIPALVGSFGFAEVLSAMHERPRPVVISQVDTVVPRTADVLRYWRTIIRSGVIGTFIGIVPGVGEDVAAWSSYAAAKRASREREKFGKGSVEGLMAAETGDNACVPGAVIPVLTLAVPGSAPAAVLLAAMLIHAARAHDHAGGADLRLRGGRHDADGEPRHPVLRPRADQAPGPRPPGPARLRDAGRLRAVHGGLLRHRVAGLRRLDDDRLRHPGLCLAPLRLSARPARARHRAGRPP
jgi:putative tricarboxylic transport membrane protein